MEFIVTVYSEKQSLKSRTNALKTHCSAVGIRCVDWPHSGEYDCLCSLDSSDSFVESLQANALMSFCVINKYPLMSVPENPLEEFLNRNK